MLESTEAIRIANEAQVFLKLSDNHFLGLKGNIARIHFHEPIMGSFQKEKEWCIVDFVGGCMVELLNDDCAVLRKLLKGDTVCSEVDVTAAVKPIEELMPF